MNEVETYDYLQSFPVFNGKDPFNLDAIQELMERLGNPQNQLKCIHVAGTNGKGSVCAFLHQILSQRYQVGLFTSPYIECFEEQIKINGYNISKQDVSEIATYIRNVVEEYGIQVSLFEFTVALAFVYFQKKHCEFAIFEVGLGGAYDATNVIEDSILDIITSIDYDHMNLLGNTLTEIASVKAGIIKEKHNVLLYPQSKEIEEVIQDVCVQNHATLKIASLPQERYSTLKGQSFVWKERKYFIPLLGLYQINNASMAIQACEWLRDMDYKITQEDIESGLKQVAWSSRFEIIQENPMVIVDGSHNLQGIQSLVESLNHYFKDQKIIFITGVLKDKNYPEMMKVISEKTKRFYTITPNNPRALKSEELATYLEENLNVEAISCTDIQFALNRALKESNTKDVICIFGSFYSLGQLKSK